MALISFGIGLAFLAIIILLVFALGSVGLYFVSKFLNLKKQDFQTAFGVSMLSYLITVFIVFLNNTLQLDFLPFSGLVLGIFISLGFIKYVYNISGGTLTPVALKALEIGMLAIGAGAGLLWLSKLVDQNQPAEKIRWPFWHPSTPEKNDGSTWVYKIH